MAYGNPIKFRDFSPDLDTTIAGTITDMDGWRGTQAGLATLPSFEVLASLPAGEIATGAFIATLVSGQQVVVVGTTHHLYTLKSGGLVEFDGGQTFSGGHWSFAVFGNDILAVNGVNVPQVSANDQPFEPLANVSDTPPLGPGQPQTAAIVEVVDEGVFMIPVDSNVYYFTGISDRTWTPNIATETVNAPVTGTPGPIIALHRIRGGVVLYKARSFYMGLFTGPPFFWSFTSISENVGAFSQDSIVNAGDLHLWIGPDDFYQFDGSSLQRIPNSLRKWFFGSASGVGAHFNRNLASLIIGQWDPSTGDAVWYFPSPNSTVLDSAIRYNVSTGKWTKGTPKATDGTPLVVVAVLQPGNISTTAGLTYIQFGQTYTFYNSFPPDLPYNSPTFGGSVTQAVVPAIIDANGNLLTATGASAGGFIVTGELGDSIRYYQICRVRPVFTRWPANNFGHLQAYHSRINGYPAIDPNDFPQPFVGPQSWLSKDATFNFIQTARRHILRFEVTADAEITAFVLDLIDAGLE